MTLDIKPKVKAHLIDVGYDEKFGARPLRRTIQKELMDPLSMEILKGRFKNGSTIIASLTKSGKISFRLKRANSDKKNEQDRSKGFGGSSTDLETVKN